MANGLELIKKASERKNNNPNENRKFAPPFRLTGDGSSAIVRFLESGPELEVCYVHEVRSPGRRPTIVPCLDQDEIGTPCPGCEHANENIRKRKFKGWINLIHFDAPQIKRGDDGKAVKDAAGNWVFEGTVDEIQVWERGITTFQDLADIDIDYKGLTSRPFKVTRKGTTLDNTRYNIAPADVDSGPVALSDGEKKLAAQKYDLKEFSRVPDYDEASTLLGGGNPSGVREADVASSKSPFSDSGERGSRFLEG